SRTAPRPRAGRDVPTHSPRRHVGVRGGPRPPPPFRPRPRAVRRAGRPRGRSVPPANRGRRSRVGCAVRVVAAVGGGPVGPTPQGHGPTTPWTTPTDGRAVRPVPDLPRAGIPRCGDGRA